MKTYLVLYIPVLHQGYLNLFKKYGARVDGIFILGKGLVKEHTYLEKEIRALDDPGIIKRMIEATGYFREVKILGIRAIFALKKCRVITANEQLTRRFAATYLRGTKVLYDSSFLRWDEGHLAAQTLVHPAKISKNHFDRKMIKAAYEESELSSEWWRHVGALIVKNRRVILKSRNQFLPTEYNPYAFGNIRDFIKAGKQPEVQAALHAEKAIISQAAREGISLRGTDMYINVFPCQDCARQIVRAGIKRCFFASGNAHLDVERIFKEKGKEVEIILVK